MKRFLVGLFVVLGSIALLAQIPATSFNQQIQAALAALGYVTSTSQFVQNSKGILYPASQYINFGATYGSAGYGFRDSAGTMQFRNNAGTWVTIPATGGAGGNVKFIVQTPDGTVPNAQALSALATGIVFNTTGTGVLTTSLLLPATNFPALTGDVTNTGGSLATTISAAAVTLAKIANASANSVLVGAGSAGSGAPYTQITLGAGMAMTGTVLSSTAAAVAGANTQVQYNNSGAFGASANFTWTNGSSLLTITGTTNSTNLLAGNNSPSSTSPKNNALAINQSWASAFGASLFDGAIVQTVWNTSGAASGQSESLDVLGVIQGSHAMTGNMYGVHVNVDDQSTGAITQLEASRNEATVENGGSAPNFFGVTSALSMATGSATNYLLEFYGYAPSLTGTAAIANEGEEYYGEDPLGKGCTKCGSQFMYFGTRGGYALASTITAANAMGHVPALLSLTSVNTANADFISGFNSTAIVSETITPSANFSLGEIQVLAGNLIVHATHNFTTGLVGSGGDVNVTDGSANFTDTANGLSGVQGEMDWGSTGTASEANAIETYFGSNAAGTITNGQSIWINAPYATVGVVTNYVGLQIDNQTWPGSTTNYAIKYNAPASKTFGVLANGNVQMGGATMTWPATNSAGALVNNGSGTLSWSSTGLFPLLAPAGTSSAPSYSWSTATGVGLYEPTTNQTGIVGGVVLGKTTSAANGTILYVSGSGIAATGGNPLIQINLNPGLDTAQTIPSGQNADGLLMSPVFTTFGSGTHALIANVELGVGTWTSGGAVVTEATTLYIDGTPTIGVSKYALHVAAGLARLDGGVQLKTTVFASLPGAPATGAMYAVSDSTTQTWGATYSGGGALFAVVVYDGSNFTVVGK